MLEIMPARFQLDHHQKELHLTNWKKTSNDLDLKWSIE